MPTAANQAPLVQKFSLEKSTVGQITYMQLHGTLDDSFDGEKVAQAVRTKNLVLSLRDVRRFASWGMAEWMDFMRVIAEKDLYLVECSTYAVKQIILVTGMLGHGKLVSFYAPYRCTRCSEEFEMLLLVPRDRDAIRALAMPEETCATCGGSARMDDYLAGFLLAISERPSFEMDDEVVAFLRSQLKYNVFPDVSRFRAHRRHSKNYTYIRMSGNLSRMPAELVAKASEGVTVLDLAGIVFSPDDMTAWRNYLQVAIPAVSSLQLLDCPPGFLEKAVQPEDLRSKLKVRTFALVYECPGCNTTTTHMLDVAQNLEYLIEGIVPTSRCDTCQSVLAATVTHDQVGLLRRLPAREHDAALDGFLAKVRTEPLDKLEDALVAKAAKPAKAPAAEGLKRALYVASALTVLIIAGLAVIAMSLWKSHGDPGNGPGSSGPGPMIVHDNPKLPERPDWIQSGEPSSALCHDLINRLMCVGVSSYRPTKNDAAAEASDAALEELVNSVGLKISNPYFRDNVLSSYAGVRSKALSALQAADIDRTSAAYGTANDAVRNARKRVAEILQASGGPAVPAQRSDWYWEEYAVEKGHGTETLVFVRYDISLDAVRALVDKYSAATPVMGSQVMTAFPALAWQYDDFTGGALVTKPAHQLASAGIGPQQIVMAVGDQRIADATSFEHRLDESLKAAADVKLTVKAAGAAAQVVTIHR